MSTPHPFSYKDRSGFLFYAEGKLYRQINQSYKKHYTHLQESGLYQQLVNQHYLVKHEEVSNSLATTSECFKVLQPELIPFIAYPYEWCFGQLKDAALLTLEIMKISITNGMVLKDATPYNVQFYNGKPIFIDTLSFEIHDTSIPWKAYYQFCETFLYPLLLEKYGVQAVHKTFTVYPNGITAENVVKLLPTKCKYNLFNYLHLYLLKTIKQKGNNKSATKKVKYSKQKMIQLIDHLYDALNKMVPKVEKSEWNTYYKETIISDAYLQSKKVMLNNWLQPFSKASIMDMGCNDGEFSLIAATNNNTVYATDFDHYCVENLYQATKQKNTTTIYPLVLDLIHPSTNQGFFNQERKGLLQRTNVDVVLMLALIHHLVIGKNLNFSIIAKQLASYAATLIMEYVPMEDEKVQQLLINKEDVFMDYTAENLEQEFSVYYTIKQKEIVPNSIRTLYLLERKVVSNA